MSDKSSVFPKFYLSIRIKEITNPDHIFHLAKTILQNEIPQSIDVRKINPIEETCNMLRADPEMFRAYRDNISMEFQDAYHQEQNNSYQSIPNIKIIADKAAENFLKLWTSLPETKVGRNHDNDIIPTLEKDLMEGRKNVPDPNFDIPTEVRIRKAAEEINEQQRSNTAENCVGPEKYIGEDRFNIPKEEKVNDYYDKNDFVEEITKKIDRLKSHPLLEYATKRLKDLSEGGTRRDLEVTENAKLALSVLLAEDVSPESMYSSLSIAQGVIWKYYKRPTIPAADTSNAKVTKDENEANKA
jgi:hypothetical protein